MKGFSAQSQEMIRGLIKKNNNKMYYGKNGFTLGDAEEMTAKNPDSEALIARCSSHCFGL